MPNKRDKYSLKLRILNVTKRICPMGMQTIAFDKELSALFRIVQNSVSHGNEEIRKVSKSGLGFDPIYANEIQRTGTRSKYI